VSRFDKLETIEGHLRLTVGPVVAVPVRYEQEIGKAKSPDAA
jgi:hypothetical protein